MSNTWFQRFRVGDILILWALFRHAIWSDVFPPVTQAVVVASTAVHWHLIPFLFRGHDVHSVCISVYTLGYHRDIARIVLAHLTHLDDIHLYFNVASFIVKGRLLERRFGSRYFSYILIGLLLSNTILFTLLQLLLTVMTGSLDYLYQCCVGLSGIAFSLKVLTLYTAMFSPPSNVPSSESSSDEDYLVISGLNKKLPRWVVPWFELVLLQKLVPRIAFSLQAAGIISGVLFARYVIPYVDAELQQRRHRGPSSAETFIDEGEQVQEDQNYQQPVYLTTDPFAEAYLDDVYQQPYAEEQQNWEVDRINITNSNQYDESVTPENYPFFGSNNTDLIDRLVVQGDTLLSRSHSQEDASFTAQNFPKNSRRSPGVQQRAATSPPTQRTSRRPSPSSRQQTPSMYAQQPQYLMYDALSPHASNASQYDVGCVFNSNCACASSHIPPTTLCGAPRHFAPSYFNGDIVRRQRRRPATDEPIFGITESSSDVPNYCAYSGSKNDGADDVRNGLSDEDDDIRIQIRRQWKIHKERLKQLSAKYKAYGTQCWRSPTTSSALKFPLKIASEILS